MTRKWVFGCLLCAITTLLLAGATTASAEAPEFGRCLKKPAAEGVGFSDSKCTKVGEEKTAHYEWVPGVVAGANGFTMLGGSSTWATSGGKTMTCTKQSAEGKYSLTNNKRWENVIVKFAGCSTGGLKCTSPGLESGELLFNELEGEVDYLNVEAGKTALKLYPAASAKGKFIEFKCVGLEFKIRGKEEEPGGGVLVEIKNDSMKTTETLKYKATKGVPTVKTWEGTPTETYLEQDFEKLGYEKLGWTLTTTVTNEEAYELSSTL